jgi:hypothetical protein
MLFEMCYISTTSSRSRATSQESRKMPVDAQLRCIDHVCGEAFEHAVRDTV